jgi:aspartyl-tRNA(Asn)/glutamyl-tRNA(Gln) amidotransferase subunit A
MSSNLLTRLTISEAAPLIASRQISPVELTEACLARIDTLNPQLNCFITRTADAAMEQARQAEKEIARGHYRGPLHGIPIAHKDLYETKGVRTTAGSIILKDHIPSADSTVVEKLNDAGAIMLGKLSMHEWACGTTNMNVHFGACKNPWQPECIPGGSSGGSAAALAAELCLGATGSDTGGSIRIPSALCGVVGLKPTYGRVSLRGVIPLSWHLDHAGPMGRSVNDVALLLQAMAGYDSDDPTSANVPTGHYTAGIRAGVSGWRVAWAGGEPFDQAEEAVSSAVHGAAHVFEQLGARLSQVTSIPRDLGASIVLSEAAIYHRERMQTRPADFDPVVLERLKQGAALSKTDYALALQARTMLRRQFERFFEAYDVLLLLTVPLAAPRRAGLDQLQVTDQLIRFTMPFNKVGLPALSLPCGFNSQGLPIGLQIVGAPWAEAKVLRAGYAYEQATEWHMRRPIP